MAGTLLDPTFQKRTYADCSGCSLCLLVCPVWQRTRDIELTPHGRNKALQNGASPGEISLSIQSCALCGACDPVCPERIDLSAMVLELRRQLGPPSGMTTTTERRQAEPRDRSSVPLLLPGHALRACPDTLQTAVTLLGDDVVVAADDGADIAMSLEAGSPVAPRRLEDFLAPLRRSSRLIVADGLLLRYLARWLPRTRIASLGECLSMVPEVQDRLGENDLYVIEPRAYHADYQRLVKHYDGLRAARGCAFNLDLQRIAIPATAPNLLQRLGLAPSENDGQIEWVLRRRPVSRIVVESMEDRAAFEAVCSFPVLHLADIVCREE